MIAHDSVETFLERLAGADPTPGGGSAAAVMGATGAALVSMVCNVSVGKRGCESVQDELLAVRGESERLRRELTEMIARDVAAFDALMAAYRLPKALDEDKAARAAAIQESLTGATRVPLECARACASVIALARRAADVGYRGVISDAGVAVLAAFTALRSAALNVYINVPSLDDRQFAAAALQEIEAMTASCGTETDAVYATVRGKVSG